MRHDARPCATHERRRSRFALGRGSGGRRGSIEWWAVGRCPCGRARAVVGGSGLCRDPRRLGCRRGQGGAARRRSVPRPRVGVRRGDEPAVRARQPRQALGLARPRPAGGARGRRGTARRGRRVRHQLPTRRPRAARPRLARPARELPGARVREHHRVRARRTRARPRLVRHGRVLEPRWSGRCARARRPGPAVPARRVRRPPDRDGARRWDRGRAVRAAQRRGRAARVDVAAARRHVPDRRRPEHELACGLAHGRGVDPFGAQPAADRLPMR